MIAVFGAGAFGTALAVVLSRAGREVALIARNAAAIAASRENTRRLPGVRLPEGLRVENDAALLAGAEAILLAVPMQRLSAALAEIRAHLGAAPLVACCKGVDLTTLDGPVSVLAAHRPYGPHALLTGPSFAADIASGLPTALTLACADAEAGEHLQQLLSAPALRLYRTTDTKGAELGGAVKNVIAIAAGAAIGAGFGASARAALLTRGYAEMLRLALSEGARPETLAGLSGLGDLVLTATSEASRNYRLGLALGRGETPAQGETVEGVATAEAVARLASQRGLDMPITLAVMGLTQGRLTAKDAMERLLARPLKEE
jgi:glycerol-3-phosphate dehydrogenase (NAD(P)+)